MRSFVRRKFLSSEGEDNEEIEDGSELKLGDAPMESPLNIKNHQALKLGDAQGVPTIHQQPSGRFAETTFLSLYILCAMLGASLYFQFCLLFCWSYACWILALFVWEKDTLRFFI